MIAGAIAKAIRPGADPGGWLVTILIGIVGAIVSGWIGSIVGLGTMDGFSIRTLLLAIGGFILVLALYATFKKKV